jgi:hypothetical protein
MIRRTVTEFVSVGNVTPVTVAVTLLATAGEAYTRFVVASTVLELITAPAVLYCSVAIG